LDGNNIDVALSVTYPISIFMCIGGGASHMLTSMMARRLADALTAAALTAAAEEAEEREGTSKPKPVDRSLTELDIHSRAVELEQAARSLLRIPGVRGAIYEIAPDELERLLVALDPPETETNP